MPESENPKMEQEEEEKQPNSSSPPPPTSADDPPSEQPSTQTNAPPFDPSRMIGIIKRKALIKELAAVYHAQCLSYCQELLELQKKWEEDEISEAQDLYFSWTKVEEKDMVDEARALGEE
ncbi:hypothetical protein HS088_TW14G00489 [Tripterygium wilfordii]|uniref:Uncharacterized protein n=1 Tax=Tripterygium wilfordii TaxID=458696 RepID=A0A7J7CQI4_TRIWF|nr:hypothetical protein HS088_TW14G00489 [Tripterygium wilfordii]